jgi:hypothetical protein
MSQQHIDALNASIAAAERMAELCRALRGNATLNDEKGENIASFRDAQRKHPDMSWEAVMGDSRLVIRRSEEALAILSAKKPRSVSLKTHKQVLQLFRSALDDLKTALAVMEALPPWSPPPGGGGKRIAA